MYNDHCYYAGCAVQFLSFTTSTQTYLVSVLKSSSSFLCSCCFRTCHVFLFFNKVFDWLFLFFMLKVMMTFTKHSLKCWAKNMSLTPIWTWTWTRFAMETFVTCLKVIWYFQKSLLLNFPTVAVTSRISVVDWFIMIYSTTARFMDIFEATYLKDGWDREN